MKKSFCYKISIRQGLLAVVMLISLKGTLLAQTRALDSLFKLLPNAKPDTVRANVLCEISFQFAFLGDADKIIEYANQALLFSKKINYKKGEARAHSNYGMAYFFKGDFNKSIEHILIGLPLHEKYGTKVGVAWCLNVLGAAEHELGNNELAMEYYQKALQTRIQIGEIVAIADTYMNIANLSARIGNLKEAMDYRKKALELYKKDGYKLGIAGAYHNMANVYELLGDYELAMENYYEALKVEEEIGNKRGVAQSNSAIGNMFRSQGNLLNALKSHSLALTIATEIGAKKEISEALYEIGKDQLSLKDISKSIHSYKRALEFAKEIEQTEMIGKIYSALGEALTEKKEFSTAIESFNKAVSSFDKLESASGGAEVHFLLAQTYLQMSNLTKARIHLDKSKALALQLKSKPLLKSIYFIHSKIDSASGDFESAYSRFKYFSIYNDSLFTDEKIKKTTQLSLRYEYDKKADSLMFAKQLSDNKLVLQSAVLENTKRNRNLIITLMVISILFISLLIYRRNERKEHLLQQQADLMEIKALKAQMNPHFIFNALNSIYNFVQLNKTEIASSYIIKFSKLMRLILKNSMESTISLRSELEALQLYIDLEKERLSHNFIFNLKIDEKVNIEETLVPPLIFQPFVENSIWHGISERVEEGLIELEILVAGESLKCIITDNGKGRGTKTSTSESQKFIKKDQDSRSYGFMLTKERIEVLNKMKQPKNENETTEAIEIKDLYDDFNKPVGVKVEFNLPYELAN